MLRFIIRRLLVTVPMVLVVVSLTWGLIRLAPGNFYTGEKPIPAPILKNLRDKYGLDKPWYVQYGKMISNTLHGDFGSSLKYQGQSVNTILKSALPVSATIGFLAYVFLRSMTKLRRIDAATIGAYYGSDSAGTFVTCVGVLTGLVLIQKQLQEGGHWCPSGDSSMHLRDTWPQMEFHSNGWLDFAI